MLLIKKIRKNVTHQKKRKKEKISKGECYKDS